MIHLLARRFLDRMQTEIDTLTQMVEELLELSKIESGKVPLEKIPCSPCKLIEQAVERLSMQAERAGLEVESTARLICRLFRPILPDWFK